jgi:hypothetical protein
MNHRWSIDDTSHPGRIFCEHLQAPRFRAELVAPDDLPDEGYTLAAPNGNWLVVQRFAHDGVIEEQDLYDSLEAALKDHEAAKRREPAAAK